MIPSYAEPVLIVADLTQAYGSHVVLKNLEFTLHKGEILGVIGENGAGKSTLVKCILGMVTPVSGSIALSCTAAAIHQELNLVNELPVYANFFLGRELRIGPFLDSAKMIERTRYWLNELSVDVDPTAETGTLSVSEKQMIEIARALDINAGILILDEPSALLSNVETERLFKIMRKFKAAGTAMIYISHKLAEVHEICDNVAILRDGELVGTGAASEILPSEMAERMVGRSLADIYPVIPESNGALAVSFSSPEFGSFELHKGEILGIAGLADSGQVELGETIAGFRRMTSGSFYVNNRQVSFHSHADAQRAGISFLSPDRNAGGIWRDFTIAENIAFGALDRVRSCGLISNTMVNTVADDFKNDFKIRCESIEDAVSTLSGGNAQKVAMAKVLASKPSVLVLNEPTQGVDVGARQEIYTLLGEFAKSGVAVLLISSDMTELLGLCKKIAVMRAGMIVYTLSGDELNDSAIIHLATGE